LQPREAREAMQDPENRDNPSNGWMSTGPHLSPVSVGAYNSTSPPIWQTTTTPSRRFHFPQVCPKHQFTETRGLDAQFFQRFRKVALACAKQP
jgi:hypothetical protein